MQVYMLAPHKTCPPDAFTTSISARKRTNTDPTNACSLARLGKKHLQEVTDLVEVRQAENATDRGIQGGEVAQQRLELPRVRGGVHGSLKHLVIFDL